MMQAHMNQLSFFILSFQAQLTVINASFVFSLVGFCFLFCLLDMRRLFSDKVIFKVFSANQPVPIVCQSGQQSHLNSVLSTNDYLKLAEKYMHQKTCQLQLPYLCTMQNIVLDIVFASSIRFCTFHRLLEYLKQQEIHSKTHGNTCFRKQASNFQISFAHNSSLFSQNCLKISDIWGKHSVFQFSQNLAYSIFQRDFY